MKPKILAGIILAVVLTASLWFWIHRTPPATRSVAKSIKLGIASPPKPVPANTAKMTTIMGRPQPIVPDSAASDWSTVQMIVDTQAGYEQRLKAISSLSPHLTDADWSVLQKFLLKPDSLDQIQLGQVIKNDLMDALCALTPPPAGLGDVLISMYRDQEQNPVIRDYAVQHLAAYYEDLTLQSGSPQEEQNIQDVLWEATNETGDSIGGTALLALKRLSQEYITGFDQGKIASTALQMADANDAGELTHITAFQICAQLGVADALPVVLQAAQNGETISVKMSAIGALGLLGGTEQVSFLKSVLDGTEDRLKPAAGHALEQIMARQNQLANQK
jgi:hypothetical protein